MAEMTNERLTNASKHSNEFVLIRAYQIAIFVNIASQTIELSIC